MKSSVSHGRARLTVRLQVLALIAGLSVPLLAGCPGALEGKGWPPPGGATGSGGATGTGGINGGTGGNTPPPGCDAPAMVFAPKNCTLVGCHGANSSPPNLTGDPFANLMGKNAVSTVGAACVGMPYVTAGNPPDGAFMKRIAGEACDPGTRMPLGGVALTQTEIDCVASWLSSKL